MDINYDPAYEWDAYISNKERAWEYRLNIASCIDCKHCYDYNSTIGFCDEHKIFINPNDGIREYHLEDCFSED